MLKTTTVLSEISRVLNTPTSALDLDASFIHNGGDSLSSVQLLIGLRRHGIHISLESIFAASGLRILANDALLQVGRPSGATGTAYKRTELKRLRSDIEKPPSPGRAQKRLMASREEQQQNVRSPMTEMQLSLVRSTQLYPGRNIISYQEEYNSEIIPAVKEAWKNILRLEPIFTTTFDIEDTKGYMQDDGRGHVAWNETTVVDEEAYLRAVEARPQSANIIEAQISVITLRTLKTQSRSTIIYSFHHAMIDGVSFSLLLSKVKSCLRGNPYDAGFSYAMFATQLKAMQDQRHGAAVEFWKARKDEFSSAATQLLLPKCSEDEEVDLTYLADLDVHSDSDKLVQHARDLGVTVASLYCAAWGLVLSKYTDSDQVCFGVVLSGRTLPIEGVETVIGPTINTLPFSLDLSRSTSVGNLVTNTFAEMLQLTSYQWSAPVHGFHRNFDSAINVRFHSPNSTLGSSYDVVECPRGTVVSDIPVHIDVGNRGKITLSYHANRYAKHHMTCLASNFANALETILNTQEVLKECLISLIGSDQLDELSRLGNSGSNASKHSNSLETLVSLFERCARSWPVELAVEWQSGSMTYSELDELSSRVAIGLTEHVRPGDIVCVDADRSVNWIVGIYGVLKTGATYFPLDQSLPDIIRDANYKTAGAKLLLVTRTRNNTRVPASCRLVLSVEQLSSTSYTLDLRHLYPRPDSSAYVCFTSGSTGAPKGVLCRHDGLVAFQNDINVRLCSRPGWKIAQFMSPCFDGSIHEIFSALSYGATLILQEESQPFEHLKKADCAILTPSVALILDPSEHRNLRAVYLVGEAVPQGVCDHWADERQLWNMYGPTEATCGATIKRLRRGKPVSLGLPNPSSRIYILDRKQSLVAPGVIGEIYLAGIQIARGYVGLPQETSARFLPDHIRPQHVGDNMYKTGDRAYWNDNGELMLLGRNDRQVKLRGFRVDLDDLEVRIARAHSDCTAAAVAVDGDQLVVFVQPVDLDIPSLKASLIQHIPPFALPHQIRAVESFPTTPAGKLDYKRVKSTETTDEASERENTTGSEERVMKCLHEVFNTRPNDENYLDLKFDDVGASSMVLISLAHRLSESFRFKITIPTILSCQSFRALAGALTNLENLATVSQESQLGEYGVSSMEHDWWQRYQVSPRTSSFNVSYASGLPTTTDNVQLLSAWNTVLSRHRILSCRYTKNGGSKTYNEKPPRVQQIEHIDMAKEINRPFELGLDNLIRVFVSRSMMLVVVSHIICDLTALDILFREVADVYHGKKLAVVVKSYAQHALPGPAAVENRSFWSNYLSNSTKPCYSVGRNLSRGDWSGSSHVCQIPQDLYNSMRRYSSSQRVTMHQLVLASLAVVLQYRETHCDITIGAPYLNRNSEDDLKVVGLFLEPLPIRVQYPRSEETTQRTSFIKLVQESSRAALSHAIPWTQLLSHLGVMPHYPDNPLFDVMVTFHDCDQELTQLIDGMTPQSSWAAGSKFKIMAEFSASKKGCLTLRLEHSDECFSFTEIRHMEHLITIALEALVEGVEYHAIARRLRSIQPPQEDI